MAKARRKAKRPPKRAGKVTKPVTSTVTEGLVPARVREHNVLRPSWWRVLHAYTSLLEEGKPVTQVAIAKAMNISTMSLWRLHKRNPRLRAWLNEQLCDRNQELVGPVINMLGTTALRTKSPEHAKLFLQAQGSLGPLAGEGAAGDAPALGVQTIVNILVPRPEVPQIAAAVPPPAKPVSTIPTITVTR